MNSTYTNGLNYLNITPCTENYFSQVNASAINIPFDSIIPDLGYSPYTVAAIVSGTIFTIYKPKVVCSIAWSIISFTGKCFFRSVCGKCCSSKKKIADPTVLVKMTLADYEKYQKILGDSVLSVRISAKDAKKKPLLTKGVFKEFSTTNKAHNFIIIGTQEEIKPVIAQLVVQSD